MCLKDKWGVHSYPKSRETGATNSRRHKESVIDKIIEVLMGIAIIGLILWVIVQIFTNLPK